VQSPKSVHFDGLQVSPNIFELSSLSALWVKSPAPAASFSSATRTKLGSVLCGCNPVTWPDTAFEEGHGGGFLDSGPTTRPAAWCEPERLTAWPCFGSLLPRGFLNVLKR
jgi:hypothetical protein